MLVARQVEETDQPLLDAAADADKFHRAAGIKGSHWKGGIIYLDDQGPVLSVKTEMIARCDIQFLTQDRTRNANALMEGFANYVRAMQKKGVKELIFSSVSSRVIRFFEKRFSFREISKDTFSLRIQE